MQAVNYKRNRIIFTGRRSTCRSVHSPSKWTVDELRWWAEPGTAIPLLDWSTTAADITESAACILRALWNTFSFMVPKPWYHHRTVQDSPFRLPFRPPFRSPFRVGDFIVKGKPHWEFDRLHFAAMMTDSTNHLLKLIHRQHLKLTVLPGVIFVLPGKHN